MTAKQTSKTKCNITDKRKHTDNRTTYVFIRQSIKKKPTEYIVLCHNDVRILKENFYENDLSLKSSVLPKKYYQIIMSLYGTIKG